LRAGLRPTGEVRHLDIEARVGRDNRSRPVNSAAVRAQIAEVLREQPEASLRKVAAKVGVSPETVRQVRLAMEEATTPAEPAPAIEPAAAAIPAVVAPMASIEALWRHDPALVSCEGGGDFVTWFDRNTIADDECWQRAERVPLSRVYEIADEARRRSEAWMRFARALEARAGKPTRQPMRGTA
jgi:hypothetical protein